MARWTLVVLGSALKKIGSNCPNCRPGIGKFRLFRNVSSYMKLCQNLVIPYYSGVCWGAGSWFSNSNMHNRRPTPWGNYSKKFIPKKYSMTKSVPRNIFKRDWSSNDIKWYCKDLTSLVIPVALRSPCMIFWSRSYKLRFCCFCNDFLMSSHGWFPFDSTPHITSFPSPQESIPRYARALLGGRH